MSDHVFISYSRKDQTYTRRLAGDLREHGFDVWIDDRIDYGHKWWQTVVQAIGTCTAFVVVMTPEAEDSDWVEREVLLALEEQKPIFPLLLHGKRFPILIDKQYASVTSGRMPPQSFYNRLGQVVFSIKPEMISIPAGEFRMGSKPRNRYAPDNEKPQHPLYLPAFYLTKTPITNAQYATFVQATGHHQPTHWGSKYGQAPRGKEDHPVVHVSWYDAVDYCGWLSKETDKRYRLPSEAEWEKAARGTDGRTYPWGNRWNKRRCSSAEEDLDDTRPVGSYLKGVSPYGLLDMAGNVWEWTGSLWGKDSQEPEFKYPYNPKDGRENQNADDEVRRVVRGGAFVDYREDTRCAARYAQLPYRRFRTIGFRIAASRL